MTRSANRQLANRHLATIRSQKISFADYAVQNGLSLHTLRWWARRESHEQELALSKVNLAPEFCRIPFSSKPSATYGIVVGDSRLDISTGFDDGDVSRLLRILRAS